MLMQSLLGRETLLACLICATYISSAIAADAPPGTEPIPGRILFWRTSRLATPITGRIASIPVRVGDHVKEGQVVAEIEPDQLKADLAIAQSDLANAISQLAVAQAQLSVQTTARDRADKLRTSVAFSGARLEDAEHLVSVASASVEAAKTEIAVKEANLKRRQVDLNLATLRAPFNGIVARHLLTVGSLVSIEDPDVLVIVDDKSPQFEIDVPAQNASEFTPGNDISYSLSSGNLQHAKIRAILPVTAPGEKTRSVLLDPEMNAATSTYSDGQQLIVFVPKE
jgi:membrane fusion protein, multidrug efflux system